MIRALIIDDEPSAIRTLELLLEKYCPDVQIVAANTDPAEAYHQINDWKPDLVFLDIQMTKLSGFDLLRKFPRINFSIIFTTAFDQYAIEAIRFSALDYLLKPIDAEELVQSVRRFRSLKSNESTNKGLYQNFLENINVAAPKDFKLAIPTTEGLHFYTPSEIIRIEGENNYSRFFFKNKKNLVTSKTLKDYEDILQNHGFIRAHKSHLVNLRSVNGFVNGFLHLEDDSRIEVSRRRKEIVIAKLKSL